MYPFIELGELKIPTYGICCAIGLGLAILILLRTCKYRDIKSDTAIFTGMLCVIGGFVGAKLLYLIVELDTFIANPELLKHAILSGFVFYGGLIGGIVTGLIAVHKNKIDTLGFADLAAAPIAIGQAMGRVGCFLAGCCYGCRTDSCLGVVFPIGGDAPAGAKLLPTQLFEAVFLVIATIILYIMIMKIRKQGIVAGTYLIMYSVWRFIIEFFRSDDRGNVGALSTSQFISLFLLPTGIGLIIYACIRKPTEVQKNDDMTKPNQTVE